MLSNLTAMKKLFLEFMIFMLFGLFISLSACKKDKVFIPQNIGPIIFNPSVVYDSMTDQDGNTYKTVTLGTQTWMAENLKVVHYRNGDPIPNVTDDQDWWNLRTGAYCDYGNAPEVSKVYGKLYNWYAVDDSRNIAPSGWHVPTNEEWGILVNYLRGYMEAGGKLKESDYTHWPSPNVGANNITGFTAIPGGIRLYPGKFSYISQMTFMWTSTINYTYYLHYKSAFCEFANEHNGPTNGCSVRCVKD